MTTFDRKIRRAQVEVQAAVDKSVTSGAEVGVQVAVIQHGHLIVDVVSGVTDPRTGAAVDGDTLFYAASTAKGVASSLTHVLVERGELDYGMRVVDVWPQFGSHGKGQVTLRQVLLHTAGVPGVPPDTTVEDLCDWDHMCTVIADEEPWWPPGTRFGYHAKTFGFLVGEIIHRATGRTISDLLRELITGPLNVEDDIHFGVPEPLLARVARQVAADGAPPDLPEPGSTQDRAMPRGITPDADYANRPDVLSSDIPSEGTMTALGVARMYAALLGNVDGVALVSTQRLATMAEVCFTGMDEVMGFPTSWAYGYSPSRPSGVPSRPGSTFGMVGMNGTAGLRRHRFRRVGRRHAKSVRARPHDGHPDRSDRRRGVVVTQRTRVYRSTIEGSSAMSEPATKVDARFSDPGAVATGWDETRRVIETAGLFWISTVRADGRPHVTPLVAVWLDDALHFSTGAAEQKALNLRSNQHVVLTTGCNRWDGGLDVTVEGDVVRVRNEDLLRRLAEAWAAKWDGRWRYEVRDGDFHHESGTALVFAVRPTKVLAFAKGDFSHTRHRF
jgi:CubicO group peptidase (beta-lactamase class C family)